MAEGDTILRAARRIGRAIGGERVAVSAPNPRGRATAVERLDGLVLERADAHGKHLLLRFGDLVLDSHLGMSGSWHVYRQGERWRKPTAAAWAVLRGEQSEAVQFGGPTLRVLGADTLRRDPVLARSAPTSSPATSTPRRWHALFAPPPISRSATRYSTSRSSPASATSSRVRPASPLASTPGNRSLPCPRSSCSACSGPLTT